MTSHVVYILAEVVGEDADGIPEISDFLKIGIATDPAARRRQVQTGNPNPLIPVHYEVFPDRYSARKCETAAHRLLADRRTSGEWFRVTIDDAVHAVREGA